MENRQHHSRFIQLSSLPLQELVINWDVYELLRRFVQSQRCWDNRLWHFWASTPLPSKMKYQFSWLWRVIGEGFGPRHDEAEKTESVIGRTLIFLPHFYSRGNSCNSHSGWKVVWCFQLHMRLQSLRLSSNLTANCSRWNDELVVIEFLATVRHWEHRLIVMMISVTVQAWTDR